MPGEGRGCHPPHGLGRAHPPHGGRHGGGEHGERGAGSQSGQDAGRGRHQAGPAGPSGRAGTWPDGSIDAIADDLCHK